jgi:hypothetical protein
MNQTALLTLLRFDSGQFIGFVGRPIGAAIFGHYGDRPAVTQMTRPPHRLFRLVLESHDGTAFAPIPKRSTTPRVTSTLQWWIV